MTDQVLPDTKDTEGDDVPDALDVPTPDELADELIHKKPHHHKMSRFFRILMHLVFYLCALAVVGSGVYRGYLWCRSYHQDHEHLKKQVAANVASKKHIRDIEKTLKVNYEFLSKYEAHYYALIYNDFSQAYETPWEIYAALVRIESNFDPTQKSDKDAKGMVQIIESTGKIMASKMGLRYKEGETLWNDLLNMMIGFTYFSEGYLDRLNDGATKDEALQHAIRRYLGGSGYEKQPKNPSSPTNHGKEKRVYISEYNITVWQEYKKLQYVFKGVCADTLTTLPELVIDTLVDP